MIADALKYLSDLAGKATAPQKIESGDPHELRYVVNGSSLCMPVQAAPRKHSVGCLDDLIRLAVRFAGAPTSGEPGPVVWHDESRVVLVINDDGHRDETATLELRQSNVFKRLCELAATKAKHEQKAFVRLLRIELAGTLDPVLLLEKVRRVRFENSVASTGTVTRQRESLGREITSKADTDGGDLPDEVCLLVPVYSTLGEREPLPCRCSVECDPAEGTFRLLPLPDELDRVQQLAMSSIAGRLSDGLPDSVPAYYGKP